MGMLIDGVWQDDVDRFMVDGAFQREASRFPIVIGADVVMRCGQRLNGLFW